MKKQSVILLVFMLTTSSFFYSCKNKMSNYGELSFDSIQINKTEHLLGDTANPACNLIINYTYPVRSSEAVLLDSLNAYFARICFGEEYVGVKPREIIDTYSRNYVQNYRDDLEQMFLKDLKSKEDGEAIGAWYSYYLEIDSRVQWYKNNLLVYRVDYNEYTGGAHGIYAANFLNIDLTNNRILKLDDIFTGDYVDMVTKQLWDQLSADNNGLSRQELEDMGYGSTGELLPTENFFLDEDGITFYYNVYEFTPYVMGPTEIKLSYKNLEPFLVLDEIIKN